MALSTIAMACSGGGGKLTLDDYFQRLGDITDDLDSRFETVKDRCLAGIDSRASEAEQIEASRCLMDGSIPLLNQFVDNMAEIDPPAEVRDAHRELQDASAELSRLTEGVAAERLAGVESVSELEALFDGPEFETAEDRADQACFAVQELANDNRAGIELDC